MKIAITTDIYYPMTNGVAVFAHNLAEQLAREGHDVMVICPSFTGKSHRAKKGRVTTIYLKSIRFPFYPDQINDVPGKKSVLGLPLPRLAYRYGIWWAPFPYRELKHALDKFRPDVIHGQTAETIAAATQHYAKRRHVPLVVTGHAYPDNITGQFKILKPIKRPVDAMLRAYFASFLKHGEYATMPTDIAIQDLIPKNFKVPVEPLSNGIDLTDFTPGKPPKEFYQKYHLPEKSPLVLYVGRVDPEKSIDHILEAFPLVLKKCPGAKLVIVGDGIARSGLEELAAAFGINEQVIFPGRITLPELADFYRAATLFVTASETETQGIVLLEAAATGLPLVAVDSAATSKICLTGQNGELVPSGSVKKFAAAITKLLKDTKLRTKYSKGSLALAAEHDLRRTVARFLEIYQEAIDLKKPSSKNR